MFELSDFASWPACMTGPYAPGCEAHDFHAEIDDLIDLLDFAALQNVIPTTWP